MIQRNILLLSLSQVLALTGTTIVIFSGPIIGTQLAPTPSLATLSNALQVVGVALFTIPASMIMHRFGRRIGFIASAGMAALGALGAAYAISHHNFALFCALMLLIGGNNAFVQQYRFAAAESVSGDQVGRAVSLVLLAGVLGGFLGPEIARRSKDLLPFGEYTGAYLVLALIYAFVILLMVFLSSVRAQNVNYVGVERPLPAIIAQPRYQVAVLAGVVAYGVMSLLMTATPISMHTIHGHTLQATAWVIQSHVIAMFLPSLVSGSLITRFGAPRIMGLGVIAMVICAALDLAGVGLINYWTALVLLGVGWNFLFVGGTVLLTESYNPPERFKAQGFNDFVVFGVQALASLSAGVLIYTAGWAAMNLMVIPVLFLVLVAIFLVARHPAHKPDVDEAPTPIVEMGDKIQPG